jgi:streptogramin lyase
LSGSTLLYNGVGTVVITASQAGNAAYSAAAPVSQTVVVNSASSLVGVSSGTETVTLTIATAGTLGAINVVTQGLPNLDYKPVSGDTDANACAIGTNYAANATCTVEYTFTPTTPGSRLGGVILLSNGTTPVLMSKSLLSGSGIGPMALFQAGGPAVHLSTSLNTPRGLTVDAAGDVFLTDMGTKQILKFAAGATTPTVLANTSGTPAATAVDGAGDVFYTTSTGIYEIPLGSGTPVAVTTSITNADNNLSVDGAGNLYLTDLSGHIYKVTAGTYGFSEFNFNPPTAERFAGMALDANGNLFAADFNGNTLYEVPAGTFGINTIYTGSPLANPESVTVDSAGNIYVSNSLQTYIYRFSAQNYAAAPVQLSLPAQHALAIGPNGALYAVYQSMLNEYPRTSGTPASFPAVNEGSNGTPQNFVLENDGNANLNISSVATGSTSFPLGTQTASTGSTPLTVLPAGTVSIPVNYVPQTTAPTGTLTVTDNSLNQTSATQTTGLYGSGIPTATKLAFSVAPATPLTAGGNAGTVQISLVDPSGNITTSSSAAVALNVTGPAGYTHTYSANASNSVATFSLVAVPLNAAGTYTYTATSGTLTAAQATESVSSGAVSSLTLTGLTTFAAPSISESATVSAVDVYGNVVPSFSGTVTLTSSDKLAVLNPLTYTYLASDAGAKTFLVTLKTAGTQKITATSGALTVSTSVLVKQDVWVLNNNQTLARLDGNGSQTTTAGTAAASSTRAGIAFDNNGDVWSASSTNGLLEYSVTGAHITVSGSSAAGVSAPTSVAVDGAGQIWVANAGNKSVSVLSSNGGAVSPSTGLQPGTLNAPTGLAIDSAGSVWVTNSGSNTMTKIIGAAAPVVSPTVTGAANNQLGVRP